MSDLALDDVAQVSLAWMEPVLIDLLTDFYADVPGWPDALATARLHTRFLLELIDGTTRNAAFLRLELTAWCTLRGITAAVIDAADDVAFAELKQITATRYRNVSRLGQSLVERLDHAFARLPTRTAPARPSATVRTLASARQHWVAPPTPGLRKLAANG